MKPKSLPFLLCLDDFDLFLSSERDLDLLLVRCGEGDRRLGDLERPLTSFRDDGETSRRLSRSSRHLLLSTSLILFEISGTFLICFGISHRIRPCHILCGFSVHIKISHLIFCTTLVQILNVCDLEPIPGLWNRCQVPFRSLRLN